MKVFIENEAGSNLKNIFDEKTLEYKKSVTVSRKYPFPYGFIENTTSGDGDNLDCFIITRRALKSGQTVEVDPAGVLEQIEQGRRDDKILAKFSDEDIEMTEKEKNALRNFLEHVFDHLTKHIKVGEFRSKEAAEELIRKNLD